MIQKKRDQFPRQQNNTLDWNKVFTDPKDGLITLLSGAHSVETLEKIFEVIVTFLFARDGDASFRESYLADLKRFSQNNDFDKSLDYAKEILNKIKNDRIEIAKNYVPKEQQHLEEEDEKPVFTSMQDQLIGIIISDYRKTLTPVILENYDQSLGKLPFIFSNRFQDLFFDKVEDFCLREIAADCDVLISKKPKLQKEFDEVAEKGTLKDMPFRVKVWDSWRQMWDINMKKQPVPQKPKLPSVVSKVGNMFTHKHEQEMERWKRKARIVKAHNQKVSDFYDVICSIDETYEAPKRKEIVLLIKTFGKTEDVFTRHNTALKQFLEQDTEYLAKTFSRFIEGKNIDLSLLYILYENPELILGETNYLKYLMRSYQKADIQKKFPYIYRYLSDFMN